MAIQSTYISEEYGLVLEQGYTKISAHYFDRNEDPEELMNKVIIQTCTYFDEEARLAGSQPIGEDVYVLPISKGSEYNYSDLYTYIKQALPAGAQDI